MKKMNQSSIKNSLSSIGKSIKQAFYQANENGYTKIFIDEPKDLISKDIDFIL
jgi:thiamine pyrophosphate-dependent acetolactate synthase large subunit-like protein